MTTVDGNLAFANRGAILVKDGTIKIDRHKNMDLGALWDAF